MSENERKILEALCHRLCIETDTLFTSRYMSPTEIGMALGKPHYRASSWACRYLCKLRDRSLVRREPPGVYTITEAGVVALEEE